MTGCAFCMLIQEHRRTHGTLEPSRSFAAGLVWGAAAAFVLRDAVRHTLCLACSAQLEAALEQGRSALERRFEAELEKLERERRG